MHQRCGPGKHNDCSAFTFRPKLGSTIKKRISFHIRVYGNTIFHNHPSIHLRHVDPGSAERRPLATQRQQQIVPHHADIGWLPAVNERQRRDGEYYVHGKDQHHSAARVQQEIRGGRRWRLWQDLSVDQLFAGLFPRGNSSIYGMEQIWCDREKETLTRGLVTEIRAHGL